ncbi:MAG: tripartite tricarboxylate transporter permease [Lachnospirales bacterium]
MDQYLTSLAIFLQPMHILIILGTSVVGIIFGAIPGLSAAIGIALLLPATFGMPTHTAFVILIAMYISGVSGSFIGATLIGIPGSSSSIATTFDAYPMTQKGEATRALTIGILASFTGTFFSILIATFLSPVIAEVALMLGPWEYFSLCFCAITLVASLAKGSMFRCLLGTSIGLMLGTIGLDIVTAQPRFTFGSANLLGGISVISITLGVFACQQVSMSYAKGTQKLPEVKETNIGGLGIKITDVTQNIGTIIRSFLLGLWVGFLPGMGSGVSNLIAYAQAKSSAKDSEKWGDGHPGGIWASETSNNASIGGAIIPMMALGIPGDSITAMLLTGLIVHGLQPGPLMITNSPDIAYLIFSGILVCAFIVLIIQLFAKKYFPLILKIPYHYLYSSILIICFIGAYGTSNSMFSLYTMLFFCVLGIIMSIGKIPTSPMLLAFILSKDLEKYFRRGVNYAEGDITEFITRPVSLIFLLVGILSIIMPFIKKKIKKQTM